MRPHPSKQAAPDAPEADMPHDFTRRDDAVNPIDDEQYERLVDREYAERDELRV